MGQNLAIRMAIAGLIKTTTGTAPSGVWQRLSALGSGHEDSEPSSVIDPTQKFNEPLIVDPKEDFHIFWIVLRKFLITTTEGGADVYPNLTVDQFWLHI
jgi:hypothetical protein